MAAPTPPTTSTLATEALKKAGYGTPTAAQLTRAWDYFGNEVKNDIWTVAKKLKSLQTETAMGVSENLWRYSCPSDFSSFLSATLMQGTHVGVCRAGGSTTTAILAADEDVTQDFAEGKEIMIYLTTTPTTALIAQITGYVESTKVATVFPAWTPSPGVTYSYIIVDSYYPLEISHINEIDKKENYPTNKGKPVSLHPIGDTDNGEFILFPVPDDAYGIKLKYYANLTTLDEAGTLHGTILNRWRNVFIQGIKYKQLENDDDNRATSEGSSYSNHLQTLLLREQYGMQDLSNLQVILGE
jgi:hypothetical protein